MSKIRQDPYQIEIADKIKEAFDEGANDIFLQAPTGAGKSGISWFIHSRNKLSVTTLSHQKVLLDQYQDLIQNYCITIKGKNNYRCAIDSSVSVDHANCQFGKECKDKENCEYFVLRLMAPKAFFLNTTYQFVLSLFDVQPIDPHTGKFALTKDLYIFDECHNLPAIFTDYRTIRIGSADILNYKTLINFCGGDDSLSEIKEQAELLLDIFKNINYEKTNEDTFEPVFKLVFEEKANLIDLLEEKIEKLVKSYDKDDQHVCKTLAKLHSFDSRSLCKYSNMIDFFGDILKNKELVIEKSSFNDTWEISIIPLRIDGMFPRVADALAPKRIFMSATIFGADRLRKELGITKNYKYIELDSRFPVENRKVFSFPVAKMNYTTINDKAKMAEVAEVIKDICLKHNSSDDSGIIFTPSYSLAKTFYDNIKKPLEKEGMLVIMNTSSSDRNDILQLFKSEKNKQNKVLISPSFSEGVNLENDFSRFQIIPKVPFLSLGSRYVSEKLKRDQVWYATQALISTIQSSGRSIRSSSDYATTYILDEAFQRLIKQYSYLIPGWFLDAIQMKKKEK